MKGICCTTTETNRLTHDMEIVTKNIDEIYRNKILFINIEWVKLY